MNMVYRILIECRKKVKRIKLFYKKNLNLLPITILEVQILIKGIKLCLTTNLITPRKVTNYFFSATKIRWTMAVGQILPRITNKLQKTQNTVLTPNERLFICKNNLLKNVKIIIFTKKIRHVSDVTLYEINKYSAVRVN